MSRKRDMDSNLTKKDLLDFMTWMEKKFEDMTKQQPSTRFPQTTGELGVSANGFSFQLVEENPSSGSFDQDKRTITSQEQAEKETINLLRNLLQVGSSHQQTLLEIRDGQGKLESAIEQEKRFMHDELKNAQEDIKKLKENVNNQTTHFVNNFCELAKRLQDKIQEVKSNAESQTAGCVDVMSQTVKEITSKMDEEMKKFLDLAQQRQLSPEERKSNIPDLRTMVDESQKDFLDKVQGKIEGHFVWLDFQVSEMKAALDEQNVQISSTMNELKNSMLTANQAIDGKVLHSETKLSQKAEDSEKTVLENLQTSMAKLEEKLTHQHQKVEEQLQMLGSQTMKKYMEGISANLECLSFSLSDQEAAHSQMNENSKTQIITLLNEKCQALEKDIKAVAQETVKTVGQPEGTTEVFKEINNMKSQIMEVAAKTNLQLEKQKEDFVKSYQSTQETVKAQIVECVTQITHKNQEVEKQMKIHVTQQIQNMEKSLDTKLTQNQENIEKQLSGNTNTVMAKLDKNEEAEKEMKAHMIYQIQETEKSLETKLTQNQVNAKKEKEASGSTNAGIAKLESNREVAEKLKMTLQIQETEKSRENKPTQNQENIEKQLSESTNTAMVKLDKNEEAEKEMKAHMIHQIQETEKSLETKLTQNLENTEKEKGLSGSTNIGIAKLENNREVEELKTQITLQIQETEKPRETKLTQSQENIVKQLPGSPNTVMAKVEKNLEVREKTAKPPKKEIGQINSEAIQQKRQAGNESSQIIKTEIETKLTNTETVKDFITDAERKMIKDTKKKRYLTRPEITDPTTEVANSTFEFYIKNFKDHVKSGKDVTSVSWHIDEFFSGIEGKVKFKTNGEMEV